MGDHPMTRVFRAILAAVNVDDPDAVCWAIHSAGATISGNMRAIDAAIEQIRQSRRSPAWNGTITCPTTLPAPS